MARNLLSVESNWRDLSTVDVDWFLRTPTPKGSGPGAPTPTPPHRMMAKLQPIPQLLLDALPWLQLVRTSRLFQLIWDEHQVVPGP